MQDFQKFFLSQALNYAFRTYFKNFNFFLKILGIALIFSMVFLGNSVISGLFEKETWFVPIIGLFCWDLLLNNLLLKKYESSEPLMLKDFLYYDFKLGPYLLYYVFIYCIQTFPNMLFRLSHLNGIVILISLILTCILSFFLVLEYFWGKYLILDKNLTFLQAIRTAPHLVYGEKKKLAWALFVSTALAAAPVVLSFILGKFWISSQYIFIVVAPVGIAFYYPITALVYISIYKQLIANADEKLSKELASYEKANDEEEIEPEDGEEE